MARSNKCSWIICSIVAIVLLVDVANCAVTGIGLKNEGSSANNVCKSAGCIEAASLLLKNMDATVSPCENFHEFACGKFLKETPIAESKSSVSVFTETDKKLKRQLRSSLEGELEDKAPRTFKVLQSFYNCCLDMDTIDKSSRDELLGILKKLGGWPVLEAESWNVSKFDWRNLIYQMRDIGYTSAMDSFMELGIELDDEDNSRYVVTLDQASTGIKQEYLSKGLGDKVVKAYYKYMVDLAEYLGADRQKAQKQLLDSLNFEMQLAKISLPREERRNMSKLYNAMTIDQLQSDYADIPWSEYLNRTLSPYKLQLNDRIIVRVPSFLKALPKLINDTPKRVLANYAVWQVVVDSAYYMDERVKQIRAEYRASITGTNVQEPRWTQCLDYVSEFLHLAVGALYVREHFDAKSKDIAQQLVHGLHNSFAGLLDKIDWMDEKTRQGAKRKLSSVKHYVAYPDEFLRDDKLDGYFQGLEANSQSFLGNHLNLKLFKYQKTLAKLARAVEKDDWSTHGYAAIVNAFYQPSKNSIQIPAGILQGAFFASSRPYYMNYAAIGWIIGHELTHGFDDEGSQYDDQGNLVNWWDPATKKEYLNRAQCIIQQYGNYTDKTVALNLNGKNTQGENIADNGGIKQAYLAYEDYERTNGPEAALPGLANYTTRQLFWISAANIWCGKLRPAATTNQIITGVHSPYEFRVLGPFSNMPQFATDFACPAGSPMNPTPNKCTVW